MLCVLLWELSESSELSELGRVRLTWSLTPHSPAEDLACRPVATKGPCTGALGLASFLLRPQPPIDRRTGRAYS